MIDDMTQTSTRKVAVNACHGGFGFSPEATARLAELQGRECYFYVNQTTPKLDIREYVRVSEAEAAAAFMFLAFDVSDAYPRIIGGDWNTVPDEQREAQNAEYSAHRIDASEMKRDDPLLVQVVEELGDAANGQYARLRVVEIPADVEWTIEEYDGYEHIAEEHRTWSAS